MTIQRLNSDTITTRHIHLLRREAELAGDHLQVVICDIALVGECEIGIDDLRSLSRAEVERARSLDQEQAIELCAAAINAARDQREAIS